MSEKQRRQIEFIDQIYNKVVLRQPSDMQPQPSYQLSDDKENNSPFGNLISDDHHHQLPSKNLFKHGDSTALMVSASSHKKHHRKQPSLI